MRVVPGKRDTTSASEIDDLPSDIVEHDSLNSQVEDVSAINSVSDFNAEVTSQNQGQRAKNKVSTSVGTSPPRETKRSDHDARSRRTRTISTGTSPPPQNMSTQVSNNNPKVFLNLFQIFLLQTYDFVQPQRSSSRSSRAKSASRPSSRHELRRSHSLHMSTQTGNSNNSDWSLRHGSSRLSFTSDSQVKSSTI